MKYYAINTHNKNLRNLICTSMFTVALSVTAKN